MFGGPLDESRKLFLIVLHVLTDLSWPAIARAYSVQFPPSRPLTSDCRTQWSRRLQNTPHSQALQAGQPLPATVDAQARAYLQTHGLQNLNALGQAYMGGIAPQTSQVVTSAASTIGTRAYTSTTTSTPAALMPPAISGPQTPSLWQHAVPAPTTTAPLPTAFQAPSQTTITQSTADFDLWPPYSPHYQNQNQGQSQGELGNTYASQDSFFYGWEDDPNPTSEHGAGEYEPPDEETTFGNGPYGGYNYPSP